MADQSELPLTVESLGSSHLIVREAGSGRRWSVTVPNKLGYRLILPEGIDYGSRAVRHDGPLGRRILAAVATYDAQHAS
ncbi:Uncharacterised protein (plasmid) [Tsukamurella tyrosinosolvens]|uniref:Uncharacterized protein n=1 Tax=Tsukamurella tyrosinosolvens TaxID=57704 RepID=A0A1H4V1R7_TSUTY|nr:hypothetical protein [Tsukamurella tyrosinosolvens]KXO91079.1 hypothetical protein AXK58_21860 [Tsukamurella tyrosinosolvens]SEC74740.1 hypothetical protein SAMN04489793_3107 [Tsukamurella tyrosinosolvens]VEH90747.1 Uncharacterised protein [Tsukamurella tyrosinosolvens]